MSAVESKNMAANGRLDKTMGRQPQSVRAVPWSRGLLGWILAGRRVPSGLGTRLVSANYKAWMMFAFAGNDEQVCAGHKDRG